MESGLGPDSSQVDTHANKAVSTSDSSAPRKRSGDEMKDNTHSKKRIVVIDVEDDGDASNKAPVVDKSAEVVALQAKVKKLETMFQGACRMTREAELRAEFAENIIDSKRGVKDDLEKEKHKNEQMMHKLAEISTHLAEEKMRGKERAAADKKLIDDAVSKRIEAEQCLAASVNGDYENPMALHRENETLKREMANMKRIMDSMGCHNCNAFRAREEALNQDNEGLKNEVANMRRMIESEGGCHNCSTLQYRIDSLTSTLSNERTRWQNGQNAALAANADAKRRIEDLTHKLSESERKQREANLAIHDLPPKEKETHKACKVDDFPHKLSEAERQQREANLAIHDLPPKEKETGKKRKTKKKAKAAAAQTIREYIIGELATVTEKSNDLIDIIQPCSTLGKYVDAASAAELVSHKLHKECGDKNAFYKKMKKWPVQCCGRQIRRQDFIGHMASKKHCNMMGQRGGGVSKAALAHWMDVMDECSKNRIQKVFSPILPIFPYLSEYQTSDNCAPADNALDGAPATADDAPAAGNNSVKQEMVDEESNEEIPPPSRKQSNVISSSGLKKEIKKEEC